MNILEPVKCVWYFTPLSAVHLNNLTITEQLANYISLPT
uniref:Uncharacterized protein n=1 Tax=Arundo donax TaxID=35708 RepID=A0A0A9HKJ1_ARUDO